MTSSASPRSIFDAKAARYDELRPIDAAWRAAYDAIVRLGDVRGRRVLDVGCGTGRLAAALAEGEHARVWGIDSSAEMVARAKAMGVHARAARAETLPFKSAWFERAVARMVIHLVDRPRAFAELARVVAAGGRVVVASADPETAAESWFVPFFPSAPRIERDRFPTADALRGDFAAAGFEPAGSQSIECRKTISRARALEIVRGKAYSTFDLLPPDEYTSGLGRAEAELPASIDYTYRWIVEAAVR
jgi:SAM-dependent methyltransferase